MRPVNQLPLSLNEMKRSPLGSSRKPDSPPKPGKREVSASPLRYSSAPKRVCARSFGSKKGIGRALTSIDTASVTENSSGGAGFCGGCVACCARATSASATAESPAALHFRKRRRVISRTGSRLMVRRRAGAVSNQEAARLVCDGSSRSRYLRMQSAPGAGPGRRGTLGLAEQLGKFFGDGTAEFFGIHDGDRAAIIARDVVTDADRDQFDRRPGLDFLDDMAQMPFQIIAGIDRQRGIVDRRAVGNHHQDLALLGTAEQALVRPVQRLAIDIFLEQALAHHQPEILPRAAPWRVGGF